MKTFTSNPRSATYDVKKMSSTAIALLIALPLQLAAQKKLDHRNDFGIVVGGTLLAGDAQDDAFLWDGKRHDLGALNGCS
jgi:hypothetical protein